MTFEEADALMWNMLRLAFKNVHNRRQSTVYTYSNIGIIQERLLSCIAKNDYVVIGDDKLKGFMCYTIHDNKMIEIHHAACEKNYIRKLIAVLRDKVKTKGVTWYRAKKGIWHYFPSQKGYGDDV